MLAKFGEMCLNRHRMPDWEATVQVHHHHWLRTVSHKKYSTSPNMTKIPCFLGLLALLTHNLCQLASANTALWIGDPGTSATTNWSDNANWSNLGAGGLGPNGNDTIFGDMGGSGSASAITSVVNNSGLN